MSFVNFATTCNLILLLYVVIYVFVVVGGDKKARTTTTGILMLQLRMKSTRIKIYFNQIGRKDIYLGKYPSMSTQLGLSLYILDVRCDGVSGQDGPPREWLMISEVEP